MNKPSIPDRPRSRYASFLFAAVLLVGLTLRLFGLSHDLHAGFIYHPDTPKQVNAVERYLNGQYYKHIGLSDYDGYPLFNSHLAEYAIRLTWPAVNAVASLVGLPLEAAGPSKHAIYWVIRIVNALLSTLLIGVVYRMGRENFSAAVGVLAAWFLALSPVDMSAAHIETSDATAGFFATVCVYFALRIYNRGTNANYIFAALAGMFAFAAKYNAGIALVAPVAAHVLRQRRWFDVFEAEQIAKMLLFGGAAVAGFFIAIPSMFTHPAEVVREIVAFLRHVSSGRRLPEDVQDATLWGRFLFSMARNGPILVSILSPCLAAASVLGLGFVLRWNRRMVILYALPLVYFLLGISLRPLSHPIYHTIMTPTLFLIGAACCFRLFEVSGRWRRPAVVAGVLAVAASLGGLANESAEEAFYYWHRDTRRSAQAWTVENVPSSFLPMSAAYAFELPGYANPTGGPHGVLFTWNSIRSRDPPGPMFELKSFDLEDEPLPFFRNPTLGIHAWSPSLRAGFLMPVFQRVPSRSGNEIVFDGGAEFLRSEKIFHVKRDRAIGRILVATQHLARADIILRNGAMPNLVAVRFGGHAETVLLAPGEARVLAYEHPRGSFPCERGRTVYRLAIQSEYGQVCATLATTPAERGLALLDAGRYADAWPVLAAAARELRHPTLAAQARIAALLAGIEPGAEDGAALAELTRVFDTDWTPSRVFDVFGIHPDYLAPLAFIDKESEDLPAEGVETIADGLARQGAAVAPLTTTGSPAVVLGLPAIMLGPGAYQFAFDARPLDAGDVSGRFDLVVATGRDPALHGPQSAHDDADVDVDMAAGCGYTSVVVPFQVPYGSGEQAMTLGDSGRAALALDAVHIRPDVVESLNAIGRVLRLIDGKIQPQDATDLLAYRPLLALGDRSRDGADADAAFACYASAARLRPGFAEPAARLEALREHLLPGPRDAARELARPYRRWQEGRAFHEAPVAFANGLSMTGYRLEERGLRRGERFGLNLYWSIERPGVDLESLAVWVHVYNSDGNLLLQADRGLTDDLALDPAMNEASPRFVRVNVPAKCRLGEYRIEVGLYTPGTGKRVKIKSTELKTRGKGAILPEGIKVVL